MIGVYIGKTKGCVINKACDPHKACTEDLPKILYIFYTSTNNGGIGLLCI